MSADYQVLWHLARHLESLCITALEPIMTPIHMLRRNIEDNHDGISCWCCCWTCGPDAAEAMLRP